MIPLPQPMFYVFALALPRGHAFGNQPPCEAWRRDDAHAFGAVTRNDDSGRFGMIALRRQVDQPTIAGVEGVAEQNYLPHGRRDQLNFDHAHPVKPGRDAINRTHCFCKAGIFRHLADARYPPHYPTFAASPPITRKRTSVANGSG